MIKSFLYLSILTIAVVGSWVGFSVYHNSITSTIGSDTSIRITPIDPNFDRETIEGVKLRKIIKADLNEKRIDISVTPSIASSPTSTSSAEENL